MRRWVQRRCAAQPALSTGALPRAPLPNCTPGRCAARGEAYPSPLVATAPQLNGCINDCLTMRKLLTEHFGFADSDITMMLDTDASTTSPTGANIKVQPAGQGSMLPRHGCLDGWGLCAHVLPPW